MHAPHPQPYTCTHKSGKRVSVNTALHTVFAQSTAQRRQQHLDKVAATAPDLAKALAAKETKAEAEVWLAKLPYTDFVTVTTALVSIGGESGLARPDLL